MAHAPCVAPLRPRNGILQERPMTRELRRIYLSNQELSEAIGGYRKVDQKFLPPGKIIELVPGEDHIAIKVELKYVDSVHVLDFNIPYAKLADILVSYCVEHGILVPRAGKKMAVLIENEVALEILVGNEPTVGTAFAAGGR